MEEMIPEIHDKKSTTYLPTVYQKCEMFCFFSHKEREVDGALHAKSHLFNPLCVPRPLTHPLISAISELRV